MVVLFGFVVLLALDIPALIYRGFAMVVLWAWFVVPQFGLAPLSVAMALGLSTFVQLFKSVPNDDGDEHWLARGFAKLVASIFHTTIALGVGWVIKGFL